MQLVCGLLGENGVSTIFKKKKEREKERSW